MPRRVRRFVNLEKAVAYTVAINALQASKYTIERVY